MKTAENECMGCGQPCLGDMCPHSYVERYYCDECGDECKLYEYDGEELCETCITEKVLKELKAVEGSDV